MGATGIAAGGTGGGLTRGMKMLIEMSDEQIRTLHVLIQDEIERATEVVFELEADDLESNASYVEELLGIKYALPPAPAEAYDDCSPT